MNTRFKVSGIIAISVLILSPFQIFSCLGIEDQINNEEMMIISDHLFFTDPVNVVTDEDLVENAYWPYELCFIDLNGNNYPEIVTGTKGKHWAGGDNYMRGLHSFEFNGSCGFDHFHQPMNFSGGLTRINLDGDDYPDMISLEWVIEGFYVLGRGFIINNSECDLTLSNWTFSIPNNDKVYGFKVGDLNADGKYDFTVKSDTFNRDGLHTSLNAGNGTFVFEGWDEGLPRYNNSDPDHSPKIKTSQHGLYDLNNDGWMDICSATGNGGSIMVREPCQYYNWISDGKGNWTDFSMNFPTYEQGINIVVADIDNDDDLDMVLTTLKTYEGNDIAHYLFENDRGINWIKRDFPDEFSYLSGNPQTNDIFEDIDGDGNVDLVMIEKKANYDDRNNTINYTNTVWVAFGNGDWTWNLVKQGSIVAGYPKSTYLVDIDLDGDKDLIFSYYSHPPITKDYVGGIICFFNEQIVKEELLFTENPVSTHLRGGSIQHFEWTLTTSENPEAMIDEFDLSISYTGIDGPYFNLESGLTRWWKDLIIPNIPSNDVYFRLISGETEAVTGPYFIHNDEDLTSFVTLNEPEKGDYLFSGEEVRFNISTSGMFEDDSIDIKLEYGSNLHYLGSIPIGDEETGELVWAVPEEFIEGHYQVFFDFSYQGKELSQSDGTVLHLVPYSSLPEEILVNNTQLPLAQLTKIDIFVKAFNGTEISNLCQYDLTYNSEIIEINEIANGSFMVKPLELGLHDITIIASIFGIEISSIITISVHKPIVILEVQYPLNPVFVGNKILLRLSTFDENGKPWSLENHEFNVTFEGDYSDLIKNNTLIDLVATRPGILKINISIHQPRIFKVIEIKVLPFLSNGTIQPLRDIFFQDETIKIDITVDDINGNQVDGLLFDVETKGPCEIIKNISNIEIIPTGPGSIKLTVRASRFNETIILNRTFTVIEDIGDLVPDKQMNWVEVGRQSVFQFILLDNSGTVDLEDFNIIDCGSSDNIEIGFSNRNSISIVGRKLGVSGINITVDLYGRSKTYSYQISSENCPRTLEIDIPGIIFSDKVHSIPFIVRNSLGEQITDYDIDVTSGSITSFVKGDIIELNGNEVGKGWIEVNVSNRDVYKVLRKEIDILPEIKSIFTRDDDYINYVDHTIEVRPQLVDVEGNLHSWDNWTVEVPDEINFNQTNGTIQLNSSFRIEDNLTITLDHYGVFISKEIHISFIPSSIIIDVVVKYSKDSDVVEAIVIDQYGNNVTGYCNFDWIGDFEKLESYKVRSNSDSIRLEVSLNGTTRIKTIDLTPDDEKISLLLSMGLIMIFVIILFVALYIWRIKNPPSHQNEFLDEDLIRDHIGEE